MKIYDYFFYKLYLFFRELNPSMPGFLAMMALSWLFLFNFFTGYSLLNIYFGIGLNTYNKVFGILLSFIIIIVHYYSFLYKKRYVKILKKFSNESKALKLFGTLGVILYIVITIWILFVYIVPNIEGILVK